MIRYIYGGLYTQDCREKFRVLSQPVGLGLYQTAPVLGYIVLFRNPGLGYHPAMCILNWKTASWNLGMFTKDGIVSFKIRFDSHHDSVNHVYQSSYKRKSNRLLQRNIERSRAWQERRGQLTIQQEKSQPSVSQILGQPQQSATPQNHKISYMSLEQCFYDKQIRLHSGAKRQGPKSHSKISYH